MHRDLDGNYDVTNDFDNDCYPEDECDRVTDKVERFAVDMNVEEDQIRKAYSRYADLEGIDVVVSEPTFRRVVVRITTHDIIYDIYKV